MRTMRLGTMTVINFATHENEFADETAECGLCRLNCTNTLFHVLFLFRSLSCYLSRMFKLIKKRKCTRKLRTVVRAIKLYTC